eukprot:CAMPEP_0115830238 /NCGR_PEP_ID=MMETSP0287-20121206/1516_1 /TAXON_ID=412157 /ORGANISM="Chrysochromulina rotalis, Strain UIO044" /LENGTH=267 /DNA_ID=CAMNT_0003283539 /DNA_START=13 /DNA_END=816 /DNA_ORIENTATION=-
MDRARLELRMSYMTKRFRKGAQGWQFVVWGRQLLLTLLTFLPGMRDMSDDFDEGSVQTAGNATGVQQGFDADSRLVVIVQVVGTLLVLGNSLALHWYVQPFAFLYQNSIESFLLVSSILSILLAFAYTWSPTPILALEVSLTGTLLLSVVAVAVYLLVLYRRAVHDELQRRLHRMHGSLSSLGAHSFRRAASTTASTTTSRSSRERTTSMVDLVLLKSSRSSLFRPRPPAVVAGDAPSAPVRGAGAGVGMVDVVSAEAGTSARESSV